MDYKQNIQDELKYILDNLNGDIIKLKEFDDKIYLELSKKEIIDMTNSVYFKIKKWIKYLDSNNYDAIIFEYKNVESDISELELCMADYDSMLHIEGISYSFAKIGEELVKLKKGSNKNE